MRSYVNLLNEESMSIDKDDRTLRMHVGGRGSADFAYSRCSLTTIWTLVPAVDHGDDWMNEFEKSKACAIAKYKFLRFYFYMSMQIMDWVSSFR